MGGKKLVTISIIAQTPSRNVGRAENVNSSPKFNF